MSDSTYYLPGSWNAVCDLCGREYKSEELRRNWKGQYVCSYDWEPRHPQDYVRPVPDTQTPPWVRPQTFVFRFVCTLETRNGIAGIGAAGCAIAGYRNPLFLPPLYP